MSTTIDVEPAPQASTTRITEPGVYPDVAEDVYHRDPVVGGSLTSTGARTLAQRTPAHFDHERRHGRPDKKEFDLGRCAHTVLLGRGSDLAVCDFDDWKTKAARAERDEARAEGRTPILAREYEQVQAMVAGVRAHPTARQLFARADGQAEVTAVGRCPETGVMCRARIDWLIPGVLVDLKTTTDASPAAMARSMASYGYMSQLAFYVDTWMWATGATEPPGVMLVAVEKDAPHCVGIGEPDEQALAWGRVLNRKARDTYRRCTDTGLWPGYSPEPVPLSLPGWQLHQLETAYDQGAYDIAPRPVDLTASTVTEETP